MKQHLVKFIVVGGISTIINMGLFFVLHKKLEVNYMIASALGFISGVFFGYFYNKKWTYKSNSKEKKEAIQYFLLYLFSLLLGILVLKAEVDFFKIDVTIANVLVIVLTTMVNFLGTKFVVFKR